MVSKIEIDKGHAVYTPLLLKIYDLLVVNFSNQFIWRCPKSKLIELHQKNISANHCDIGVGTGYYLKHCQWPEKAIVTLMDLNTHSLAYAKQQLAHLNIETLQADIFQSDPTMQEKFDSISINYLLHCLPGSMSEKSIAIKHAVSMLKKDGVLFGATILSDEKMQTKMSRKLMSFYNSKSIFSNKSDNLANLTKALKQNLYNISITYYGCVAVFRGQKKV